MTTAAARIRGRDDQVAVALRRLWRQQRRVAAAAAACSGADWVRPAPAPLHEELVAHGHLREFSAEAGWAPRDVVGHLRDSARVFTARIVAVQTGGNPLLRDFVTDAGWRLEKYASTPRDRLRRELAVAQAGLRAAVAGIPLHQLHLSGRHEVTGPITLAELVDFLPGHQRDHADQLTLLTSRPRTR